MSFVIVILASSESPRLPDSIYIYVHIAMSLNNVLHCLFLFACLPCCLPVFICITFCLLSDCLCAFTYGTYVQTPFPRSSCRARVWVYNCSVELASSREISNCSYFPQCIFQESQMRVFT